MYSKVCIFLCILYYYFLKDLLIINTTMADLSYLSVGGILSYLSISYTTGYNNSMGGN